MSVSTSPAVSTSTSTESPAAGRAANPERNLWLVLALKAVVTPLGALAAFRIVQGMDPWTTAWMGMLAVNIAIWTGVIVVGAVDILRRWIARVAGE